MTKLHMFNKGIFAFVMTFLLSMPAYADGEVHASAGGAMGVAGVAALSYAVKSPKPSAEMKAEYATMNRQEAMLSGEALEAYRLARGYKWHVKTGHIHYDGFYPKTAEQAQAILKHNPRFYSALAGAALVPGGVMVGIFGHMMDSDERVNQRIDKEIQEHNAALIAPVNQSNVSAK